MVYARGKSIVARLGRIGKWSMCALFVIGICCFFFAAICAALAANGVQAASSTFQLPIGEPIRLLVDSQARVFCLDKAYRRLQIYDREGRFMRGWFVPIGDLHLGPNEQTVVLVRSPDECVEYDLNGSVLQRASEHPWALPSRDEKPKAEDAEGNSYAFDSTLFSTRIVRIGPSGERTTLVKEPLHLWLIRWPFPVALYLLVPLGLWAAAYWVRERRLKRHDREATRSGEASRTTRTLDDGEKRG